MSGLPQNSDQQKSDTKEITLSSDIGTERTNSKYDISVVKLSGIEISCIDQIGSCHTSKANGFNLSENTHVKNSHAQLASLDTVSGPTCNIGQDHSRSKSWFPPLQDMGNQQGSEGGKKSPERGKKKDHRKKESPKSSKKSSKQSPPGATSNSRSAAGSAKSKTLPVDGKLSPKPSTASDKLMVKAADRNCGKERQKQSMVPSTALLMRDQPSVPDVYTDAVDLVANLNLDADRPTSGSSSDDDNTSFESVSCATPLRTASPNVQRVKQNIGSATSSDSPVDRVEELGKSIERTIIERFSDTQAGATREAPAHMAVQSVLEETKVEKQIELKQQSPYDQQEQMLNSTQTPEMPVTLAPQSETKDTQSQQHQSEKEITKQISEASKPLSNVTGEQVDSTEPSVVNSQGKTKPSLQTDQAPIPQCSGPPSQTDQTGESEETEFSAHVIPKDLSTDIKSTQAVETALQSHISENTLQIIPDGSLETGLQRPRVQQENEVQHKEQLAPTEPRPVSEFNMRETHSENISPNEQNAEQTSETEPKPKQNTEQTQSEVVTQTQKKTKQTKSESVPRTEQQTEQIKLANESRPEQESKQTKHKTVSEGQQKTEWLKSEPASLSVQVAGQTDSEIIYRPEQNTEQMNCEALSQAEEKTEKVLSENAEQNAQKTEQTKSEIVTQLKQKPVHKGYETGLRSQQKAEQTTPKTVSQIDVKVLGSVSQIEQKTVKLSVQHSLPTTSESVLEEEQLTLEKTLPTKPVCVKMFVSEKPEQHAVPQRSVLSQRPELISTTSESLARGESTTSPQICELMPHAIPKSGLLKTDSDVQSDSEPPLMKQTSQIKPSINADNNNLSAKYEHPKELDLDNSPDDSPTSGSPVTDLFIAESNEELHTLKTIAAKALPSNQQVKIADASASSEKRSIVVEYENETPQVDRSGDTGTVFEGSVPSKTNSTTAVDNKTSKSSTPTTPLSRLENPLVESLLMLIKQTMESDTMDETHGGDGLSDTHLGKGKQQWKSDKESECMITNAGTAAGKLCEESVFEKINAEAINDETAASENTLRDSINIEEDTDKTLTPEDMAEFERLKRQAMNNDLEGNDADDGEIEDDNDDTLTQEDLAEFDRLKRKIMHVNTETLRTEYPINTGEDLSYPLHIVDKFDLSSGETTEDSVIERPVVKMEPVLASTQEEESSHDGLSIDGKGPSEDSPDASQNRTAQKDDVKSIFSTVPESPQMKRRSLTEDEIKQQIRKFMIPEMKEALPQVGSLKQMLEDLHDITPTSEQTPSVEDRDDMTSPDHPTGSGLRSRTSITSSELDMSEQRDDVSTDADDEDDSASEVLFCKTYTEPERGSEVLVSCTVVNSALKWEEGGSSDEFWADSSAAEEAYKQVEISADAANRHFSHARSQMHDIQQHLQALRYQMQEMEKHVVKTSLPSTDEFCFDDPERRAITD